MARGRAGSRPEPAPARRGARARTARRHIGRRVLLALLADDEPLVAEAAAFALGEHPSATPRVLSALSRAATGHEDALVREATVAALGAMETRPALPAVLSACDDKPTVRRHAVLALAAFEGKEVEARLRKALEDRDWQTRTAAEQLLER